jgi:hypothetical protein
MLEVREKRDEADKTMKLLGQTLTTPSEMRQFFSKNVNEFTQRLSVCLTGKKGGMGVGSATIANNASAKMHVLSKEFMDKVRMGRLMNIQSWGVGTKVLVRVSDGSEMKGGSVLWKDDAKACVENHSLNLDGGSSASAASDVKVGDWIYFSSSKRMKVKSNAGGRVTGEVYHLIDYDDIRTDPSWLEEKIVENRTEDLACFTNAEVFNNLVAEFITTDWEPLCYELLAGIMDLLTTVCEECINDIACNSRYLQLKTFLEVKTSDVIQSLSNGAKIEIAAHLNIEKYPYTQDHYLFETISAKRNKRLQSELKGALLGRGEVAESTIKSVLDGAFGRNQRMSVDEHTAEEMEVMLEAYGKVCFKRVIDKTPQIAQKLFRDAYESITAAMCGVSDDELRIVMKDDADVRRKYDAAKAVKEEMDKAMKLFRRLQTCGLSA